MQDGGQLTKTRMQRVRFPGQGSLPRECGVRMSACGRGLRQAQRSGSLFVSAERDLPTSGAAASIRRLGLELARPALVWYAEDSVAISYLTETALKKSCSQPLHRRAEFDRLIDGSTKRRWFPSGVALAQWGRQAEIVLAAFLKQFFQVPKVFWMQLCAVRIWT